MYLNKSQERKREQNGKPRKIKDLSMQDHYQDADEEEIEAESGVGVAEGELSRVPVHRSKIGDQAFLDLTDRQNDEFVYLL